MSIFKELRDLADAQPDALKIELLAALHKINHPMKDILAKVPGETVSERARAIGVGRQHMYIWFREQFRPAAPFAKSISDLTGVPVEHIMEYGNDAGGTVAAAAHKLARGRKATSRRDGGVKRRTRQRRKIPASNRS